MVHCAVKGCSSSVQTNKNISFFKLPKLKETRNKWIALLSSGVKPVSVNSRICELHFDLSCIRKRHPRPLLMPNSIPTLNILKSLDKNITDGTNKIKDEAVDTFENISYTTDDNLINEIDVDISTIEDDTNAIASLHSVPETISCKLLQFRNPK